MNNPAYDFSWVGIDAGREGLWQEPVWSRVIELIGMHEGERVYNPSSPIYLELIKEFPDEKWCSLTPEKKFRPLFRDYPNSWTRTDVVSLKGRVFRLTSLGHKLLDGIVSKSDILINLFSKHVEENPILKNPESPFSILAHAFLDAPRPLTTNEIYWIVMKNFRPGQQNFKEVCSQKLQYTPMAPARTPFRRIRHMLILLRAAEAIESYRRGRNICWSMRSCVKLNQIVEGSAAHLNNKQEIILCQK